MRQTPENARPERSSLPVGGRFSLTSLSALPMPMRPLSRRIPILMVTMIAVSLTAMVWLGFEQINRYALEAELAHLQTSTNQLRSSFQLTLSRLRVETAQLAAARRVDAAASAFATAGDRAAAQRLLAAHRARSSQFVAVAIWSADGKLVAVDGSHAIAMTQPPAHREARLASSGDPAAVTLSKLVARGDTIIYSATAPIIGADSTPLGYVVATRRLVNSAEGAALYGSLVGPHARILLGNADDPWAIDLARGGADGDVPAAVGFGQYRSRSGVDRFYSLVDIADTPWRVLVEEPRHLALAPARRFAFNMLAVAAVFILIAAALAWVVIGRSLRPMAKVTQAVIGVTRGHTDRVPVSGDDEIAQLGHAFNDMVEKVASRTDALLDSIHEHQESENRYRALIDHFPDGIMVHRNRQIVFVNPACARMFGEDAQKLIGRSILDFVDPDQHEVTLRRLDEVDVGGHVPVREFRLHRADGKRVVVESTNMALSIDGAAAIQTILHDVSDRHLLEERLRQSQKMEAVGRLAGGIAHDFNNLLTVIDAHAEFALRPDEREEERAADIEEIRRASASAARLTRQLLTFSRKQTGAPASIDLSDAVKDVLVMLNRLIGDDVVIDVSLANDLWPVFADPSHMEQVLLNLALNARDAMPSGGRLAFSTANTDVGPDYVSSSGESIPEGEYVVLTVEDTGVGMSAEVASKVFEPFFTTKGAGRGTGLGLATVYGIIKQSEGYIWLYSEPARGTVFKIMLPRYQGQNESRARPRASDQSMAVVSAHILLVEDQPAVRSAISRFLRTAGFRVTDVPDAEAALRVVQVSADFDMVVTDMVMPGKSGAELVADLAVVLPGIPVVIMSGYSEEMTHRQWQLPANAVFVAKPVSPRTLVRVVSEMLAMPPRSEVAV